VDDKSPTLTYSMGKGAPYDLVVQDGELRRLARVEAERLQGLPDGYTGSVSRPQALKGIGNAFNVQDH
jgi:site-specific DNA-cytosine methylase